MLLLEVGRGVDEGGLLYTKHALAIGACIALQHSPVNRVVLTDASCEGHNSTVANIFQRVTIIFSRLGIKDRLTIETSCQCTGPQCKERQTLYAAQV